LVAETGATILIPASARDGVTREIVYLSPVPAPVKAGDRLGELVIRVPGMEERRLNVVAAGDVAEAGFTRRIGVAAEILMARLRELAGL
jgi:D-alanyl-D-alanine carboxypeptidase (penicillin-binding protein 5/6)